MFPTYFKVRNPGAIDRMIQDGGGTWRPTVPFFPGKVGLIESAKLLTVWKELEKMADTLKKSV